MTRPPAPADGLAREVRLHVFQRAADTGVVPQPSQIAAALARPQAEVEQALKQLAAGKVLILAPNDGNIWLPIPFVPYPLASGSMLVAGRTGASAFGTRSGSSRHSGRMQLSAHPAATVATLCYWRSHAGH